MILSRIAGNLRAHNWTAVLIELAIVVVGVFIGIQVSNWNDAVRSAEKEAAVLGQLRQEFVDAIERTRNNKELNDRFLQASLDVLAAIQEGVEPPDRAAFLETISLAGDFAASPVEPTTLVELVSSGRFSALSSPALRTALVTFHESIANHQEMADLVLQRVSTPHDGFHAAVILNPDFLKPDQPFLLDYTWDRLHEAREQLQVLVYGKTALSRQMEDLIAEGEVVIVEIDASNGSLAPREP